MPRESLDELITRLSSVPLDAAGYRVDGETYRAILHHLRGDDGFVAVPRMHLGKPAE